MSKPTEPMQDLVEQYARTVVTYAEAEAQLERAKLLVRQASDHRQIAWRRVRQDVEPGAYAVLLNTAIVVVDTADYPDLLPLRHAGPRSRGDSDAH